ncbi:9-O-acetylesterase [Bacteroidia bacterium]|nr:9-O-acetylesterase [Bacteroidia bacterium]
MKKAVLTLFAALLILGAQAGIKLPALISDNMVLQRRAAANLWGWASPGAKVTVKCSWNKKSYTAQASGLGSWKIAVATSEAGGPYSIEFSEAGSEKVTVKDVYIGEVWICSGQSNMGHMMKGMKDQPVDNSKELIAESGKYNIRVFMLAHIDSQTPADDCQGKWLKSDPQNTPEFSATAYLSALQMYKRLGVPMGMVVSCWGGSRIEAWMAPETIAEVGGVDVEALNSSKSIQRHTSLLYNGMILPIKNYTPRGFIWFQIAANMDSYRNYGDLLAAMVASWRELWGEKDKLPFINIQGPVYPWGKKPDGRGLPLIVEKQFEARNVIPDYYVAVSSDIGGTATPHFPQKGVVGERVALLALEHVYGVKGLHADAPDFGSVTFGAGKATVAFTNAGDGLVCKGDRVLAFELAGADRKFYPAEAAIINGSNVVEVSSKNVPSPVALRYAFRNYCLVSLYNKYGQTPRSYRTDKWDDAK